MEQTKNRWALKVVLVAVFAFAMTLALAFGIIPETTLTAHAETYHDQYIDRSTIKDGDVFVADTTNIHIFNDMHTVINDEVYDWKVALREDGMITDRLVIGWDEELFIPYGKVYTYHSTYFEVTNVPGTYFFSGSCIARLNGGVLTVASKTGYDASMDDHVKGNRAEWSIQPFDSYITKVVVLDKVTWIGDYAFYNLPNLKEVEIASSVAVMGDYVFSGSGLETITIPETVTSIGTHLFEGCPNLKSVTFPSWYKNISDGMFTNCDSITDLSFIDGMESIGSYAFSGCGIEDLSTLPNSIVSVGNYAFSNCKNIESLYINWPTIPYGLFAGCSNLTDLTIGADVSWINSYSFSSSFGLEEVKFEQPTYTHNIYIGRCTSDGRDQLAFPHSAKVKYIGDNHMYLCSGDYHAWEEGKGINACIDMGVTPRPDYSYGIHWVKNYQEECDATFDYYSGDCHVIRDEEGNLTISKRTDEGANGTGRMADYADGWNIHTRAPWGGTQIPVTNVVIEAGVTYIGNNAFSTCNQLETITFGADVESIGRNAFNGCGNIKEIELPNNLTDIGAYAFNSCSSLTTITVPNTVANIGVQAFGNCRNLADVQLPNTLETIADKTFINCGALGTITIPASVATIGSQVFYNCTGLNSVNFETSSLLTTIGVNAFYQCEALETIELPSSLTTIRNQAFYGCVGLETLTIPALVSNIGSKAFYGCESLATMTFVYSENDATLVTTQDTFKNCNPEIHFTGSGNARLYNVAIKEEVVDGGSLGSSKNGYVWRVHVQYESGDSIIDIFGFRAIVSKKTNGDGSGRMADYAEHEDRPWDWKSDEIYFVVIEDGITYTGKNTFSNLSILSSVILPSGLITIGEESFANNNSLREITIPNSVTTFGDSAFAGSSLSKITFIRPDMSKELSTVEVGNNVFTKGYFVYVGDSDMYLCDYRTMIEYSRLSGTTLTWRRHQYEIFTQSDDYSIETSVDDGINTKYAGNGETVYVKISSDTALLSQFDLIGIFRQDVTKVQDIIDVIGNKEITGNVIEGEILNTILKVADGKIVLVCNGNIIAELTDDFKVSDYYNSYPNDYEVYFTSEENIEWRFSFIKDELTDIGVTNWNPFEHLFMRDGYLESYKLEPLKRSYIEFTKINDGLYSYTMSDSTVRIVVDQYETHPIYGIITNSTVTVTNGDEQVTEARKGDTITLNIETNDNMVVSDLEVFYVGKPITSIDTLISMMGNATFKGTIVPPLPPDFIPVDFSNLICKLNDKGNFVVLNGGEVVVELTGGTLTYNVNVIDNPMFGKDLNLEVSIQNSGYTWKFIIGNSGILTSIIVSNEEGDIFRGNGHGNGDYNPFEKVNLTTITEGKLYTFTMPKEDVFVRVTSVLIPNIDIETENGNINVTKDKNPEKPIVADDTVTLNIEPDSGYILKDIKVYGLTGLIRTFEQLVALMGNAEFTSGQLICKVNEQGHFVIMNGSEIIAEMTDTARIEGMFIPPLNRSEVTANTGSHSWTFIVINDVLTSISCSLANGGEQIFSAEGTGTGEMIGEVLTLTTVIEGSKYTFTIPDCDIKIVATFEEHVIPEHDHDATTLELVLAKDATCEEAGNIAYYHCTVCGKYFSDVNGENEITLESTIIPALTHNYQFVEFVWDGFTAQAKYVCSHDNTHVDLRNAVVTNEVTTAPTCTVKGVRTYTATCDGHTATKTEDVDALNHDYQFDSFVWNQTVPGNWTAQAKYVCSHDENHVEFYDAAITSEVTTAPTCTETGVKVYTATYNGNVETKNETLDALGHDWGEWEIIREATDEEEGLGQRVCKHDNTHVDERTIPVHTHDANTLELVAAKAATCTEPGNTAYYVCKECGKIFSDISGQEQITLQSTVIVATGHTAGEWITTKEPTCTEKGSKHKICTVCGTELEVADIDALGHDYQAVVTAPTCTDRGYTTHTCSRCDDSYVDTYVDANGHTAGEWVMTKEPTCTEKGSKHKVCTVCGAEVEVADIDALGHDYQAVVTEPTCTERGYTTHTCSRCDDSYVDAYVEALGHSFGEWTVTKEAQVGVKGEETRTCSVCGAKETRAIAALPYVPVVSDEGEKVYTETVTAEEPKDVTELFAQAKEEEGSVEIKATTEDNKELVIVFDSSAVQAIGDANVTLSAKVVTENVTVENAELVLEVKLEGATFEGGEAIVSIPFEKEVPTGKVAKVYYIADDGTRTDMNATLVDGKIVFTTNHFSTYAVLFEDAHATGLSGGAIAGIVIGCFFGLLLIACAVLFILHKKGIVNIPFLKK